MLLNRYDYQYTDNGFDDVNKNRTVAFIVCDHVPDIEDYEKMDAALDKVENILDKIYNRIRKDIKPSSEHDFLKYAKLGNILVTPVENYADSNYGYFVSIEILSHHNTSV